LPGITVFSFSSSFPLKFRVGFGSIQIYRLDSASSVSFWSVSVSSFNVNWEETQTSNVIEKRD